MLSPPSPGWLLPACALGALLASTPARAAEPAPPAGDAASGPGPQAAVEPDPAVELRALERSMDFAWRLLGSVEFGCGLRFNNPYRLATELGNGPESVSLIAPYADLGLAFSYGPPDGLQYGAAVHTTVTMSGVFGLGIAPAFQVTYRGPRPFLAYGRVGPGFALTPDPTLGVEVAGGFGWFLTGHLAVASELVFDLWWGAGTNHVAVATYPLLSAQLGLLVDYEILP
jgi:hypothetical protein